MRCAIYVRVSTEAQAAGHLGKYKDSDQERWGIPRQINTCREYAASKGWTVIEDLIYVDAHTGTILFERPMIQQALADAKAGKYDVLLADEISRLSRETAHQGYIKTFLSQFNVVLDSATEDIASGSIESEAMFFFRGMAAKLERQTMIQRTTAAKKARPLAGKLPTSKKPKYGYVWPDPKAKDRLVENPPEAEVVREIYRSYVGGWGMERIAIDLMNRAVLSPSGDRHWNTASIRNILADETYTGVAYGNVWTTASDLSGKRRKVKRPKQEWILLPEGVVEPIIDRDLFDRAAMVRVTRKREATRNNQNPTSALLRGGYIRCHNCGGALIVSHRENGRARYVHDGKEAKRHGCVKLSMYVDAVDGDIWDVITHVLQHPETIRKQVEGHVEKDPVAERIAVMEKEVERVTAQHRKAVERMLAYDDADEFTAASMKQAIRGMADTLVRLKDELEVLRADQQSWQAGQQSYDDLMTAIESVRPKIAKASYADKRLLIHALTVEVRLYPVGSGKVRPKWDLRLRLHPEAIHRVKVTSESWANSEPTPAEESATMREIVGRSRSWLQDNIPPVALFFSSRT